MTEEEGYHDLAEAVLYGKRRAWTEIAVTRKYAGYRRTRMDVAELSLGVRVVVHLMTLRERSKQREWRIGKEG